MVEQTVRVYPRIPSLDEQRVGRRPFYRNRELYNQVLQKRCVLARATGSLGFWGLSAIGHLSFRTVLRSDRIRALLMRGLRRSRVRLDRAS